jgi:putative PEP-CTERM system TPR-repeat lipoprotein
MVCARTMRVFPLFLCLVLCVSCNTDPSAKAAKALERGKTLLAKNDSERAVIEFMNAVAAQPNNAEAHYQLALAYIQAKRLPPAISSLVMATKIDARHKAAQIKLAELMTAKSTDRSVLEDAVARMEGVLASDAPNAGVLTNLAMAELKLGEYEAGKTRLDEALTKFPADLRAAATLASFQFSRRDYIGAEATLKKAATAAPKSAEAGLALASMYLLMKRVPDAEREFDRVLQLDGRNVAALTRLAWLKVTLRQSDQAESLLKRLATLEDGLHAHLLATFYLQGGRKAEALAEFKRITELRSKDRDARRRYVNVLIGLNKEDEAQTVLAKTLQSNPKDVDAHLHLGQIYVRAGRLQEAEAELKQVLEYVPDSADARYGLSKIYSAAGREALRRQELSTILGNRPTLLPVRIELAMSFLGQGHPRQAIALLDEAEDYQRGAPSAVLARNWAWIALANSPELEKSLKQASKTQSSPELLTQQAYFHLLRNEYAQARSVAEPLWKADRTNTGALDVIMQSYVAQKQVPLAIQTLKTAESDSPFVTLAIAKWLHVFGKHDDSRSIYQSLIAQNPGNVDTVLALAKLDLERKSYASARAILQPLVKKQPYNVAARTVLGDVEYFAGEFNAAIQEYQKAVEFDSMNPRALNSLAYVLASVNPDQALTYAEKAVQIAPEDASIRDTLGWIYFRKGMYTQAVTHLKTAVIKEPTPRREFHLGMSYIRSGEQQIGKDLVYKAIARDPNLRQTEQGW